MGITTPIMPTVSLYPSPALLLLRSGRSQREQEERSEWRLGGRLEQPAATKGRWRVQEGRDLTLVFRAPVPLGIQEINSGIRYIDTISQFQYSLILEAALHKIIFMGVVLGGGE